MRKRNGRVCDPPAEYYILYFSSSQRYITQFFNYFLTMEIGLINVQLSIYKYIIIVSFRYIVCIYTSYIYSVLCHTEFVCRRKDKRQDDDIIRFDALTGSGKNITII